MMPFRTRERWSRRFAFLVTLLTLTLTHAFTRTNSRPQSNRLTTPRLTHNAEWRLEEPYSDDIASIITWDHARSTRLFCQPRYTLFMQPIFSTSDHAEEHQTVEAEEIEPIPICQTQEQSCRVQWKEYSESWRDVDLQVLSECVPSRTQPNPSLPSISPTVRFRIPTKLEMRHQSRTPLYESAEFRADPNVRVVKNDIIIRAELQLFFELTQGQNWRNSSGWGWQNVSLCDWYGITCSDAIDPTESVIVGFDLSGNSLVTALNSQIENSFFKVMSDLRRLDLSRNHVMLPMRMDLSSIIYLEYLNFSSTFSVMSAFLLPPPTLSRIRIIDVSFTTLSPTIASLPNVEEFYADHTITFINFGFLPLMPRLRIFHACQAKLVTTPTPTSISTNTGNITQYTLAHLNATNPVLEILNIGGNTLNFALTNDTSQCDFPTIRSDSLRLLNLSASQTLHCLTQPSDYWLQSMPRLEELYLTDMQGSGLIGPSPYTLNPSVYNPNSLRINTTAFRFASPSLRVIALDRTTVIGDLSPLLILSRLERLTMTKSRLAGVLPLRMRFAWPRLTVLDLSACLLTGPMPSFHRVTNLTTLVLSTNRLSGELPAHFLNGSISLETLSLASNQLIGYLPLLHDLVQLRVVELEQNFFADAFPDWPLPRLEVLNLAHNSLFGPLPPNLWTNSPLLRYFDASQNFFYGPIPDPIEPKWLATFSVSSNQLEGPIPRNVIAVQYDVSYNSLSGSVTLSDIPDHEPAQSVNIGFNPQLSCPLNLSGLKQLNRLDLPNAGMVGCDWNNVKDVNLPSQLSYLDISNCGWQPMLLSLEQAHLTVFKASNASIRGFSVVSKSLPLHTLALSNNPFRGTGITNNPFTSVFIACPNLGFFYCDSCQIEMDIMDFIASLNAPTTRQELYELSLANNQFTGSFAASTWLHNSPLYSLPTSLRMLVLAGNAGITGVLTDAASGYSDTEYYDFSGTGLVGPIPPSWAAFLNLQRLSVQNTRLSCQFVANGVGRGHCVFPTWITINPASQALTTNAAGYSCPALGFINSNISLILVDANYYHKTLCECDAKFFGQNGQCIRCPPTCTCHGGTIQDCWPIIDVSDQPDQPVPSISISALLQCPLTVTGRSLCNPHAVPWPGFNFTNSESVPYSIHDFCYTGHTGRLCSRCDVDYFSSGRWCLPCINTGAHVAIIGTNIILFFFLLAYLYLRSPTARASLQGVRVYQRAWELKHHSKKALKSTMTIPESTYEQDADGAPEFEEEEKSGSTESDSVDMSTPSVSVEDYSMSMTMMSMKINASSSSDNDEEDNTYSNPLRLLVFHGQQLSILLLTTTSLPPVLAGLMSMISSGSGFSIASVLALECISHEWSLTQQAWAAFFAPIMMFMITGIIYVIDQFRMKHGYAASPYSSRIYGVLVSLLYILVFPCATTSLSAIACTDLRQVHASTDEMTIQPADRIYLNIYPYIECDAHWRSDLLPPGLLGTLFWFIFFPAFSVVLFRRLRLRVRAGDPTVWPMCVELFKPYHGRWWWWEQTLLVRRLILVAIVTIIPTSSLYLPISLFGLIQLSALLQHQASPYRNVWLNRGELLSLYLLLLNYITALVLHEQLSGGTANADTDAELNTWTISLFFANIIFIFVLVLLLFRTGQRRMINIWQAILKKCPTIRFSSSASKKKTKSKSKPNRSNSIPSHPHSLSSSHIDSVNVTPNFFGKRQAPTSSSIGTTSSTLTPSIDERFFGANSSSTSQPFTFTQPNDTPLRMMPNNLRQPLLEEEEKVQL